MLTLELVTHRVSFWFNHSANVEDGVGLVVLHQENKGVIYIEEFGVPQLLCAEDAGVIRVSIDVQLEG